MCAATPHTHHHQHQLARVCHLIVGEIGEDNYRFFMRLASQTCKADSFRTASGWTGSTIWGPISDSDAENLVIGQMALAKHFRLEGLPTCCPTRPQRLWQTSETLRSDEGSHLSHGVNSVQYGTGQLQLLSLWFRQDLCKAVNLSGITLYRVTYPCWGSYQG